MAIKFTKVCGADRPRTKLDFGRIAKKVTKIHHPGCCGYMIAGGSLCSVRSALCVVIGTIHAHVVYGRVVSSFFKLGLAL